MVNWAKHILTLFKLRIGVAMRVPGAMLGGGFFLYRGIPVLRNPVVMVAMGSLRASLVQWGPLALSTSLDGLFFR
ncbi:MAG: hypothetical protein HQL88_04730 [Magnetococcales bacterium]|nr:hypothetical protein [Magnetococcales bacterium]